MINDRRALQEIASESDGDANHVILHYPYVPTSAVAGQVTSELKQRGYSTENRPGADGESWLVLAKHEAVPTEAMMTSLRQSMEELMDAVGGEYDG